MAIKTVIKKHEAIKTTDVYPRLVIGKNTPIIYLQTGVRRFVVLSESEHCNVGVIEENCLMAKPFHGSLTLSNDE